ncbi:hypothetical protein PROFUN_14796 [Planoprotostelium fungivorum]|uniref:Uncharacterized protein n=1 Tax=Planoprotostelium fungivorum TaxID=1890364 RepID=A0A2P6MYL9_9EUKA|nr:hypothetical protein PROFUN_14796 [Planoprotostelium fungivorum]
MLYFVNLQREANSQKFANHADLVKIQPQTTSQRSILFCGCTGNICEIIPMIIL